MTRVARYLKRLAFGLAALFTLFALLMTAGETVDDPGGWRAAGLIASWLAPLIALTILARWRPGIGTTVLALLTLGIVAIHIWAAIDPRWWDATENGTGPVRAVLSFMAIGPMAVLALRRTGLGGAMMLVLGIVPIVLSPWAPASEPMRAFGTALAVIGALFLVSALAGRTAKRPTASEQHYPEAA